MKNLNVPMAVLSVVLSVLLWMVVYVQNMKPVMPVRFAVKLSEEGLDTSKYIVTRMDDLFSFTAMGPEEQMPDKRNEDLTASVDLTSATPGTHSYPVRIFPDSIQKFIVEKTLTTKVTVEPFVSKQVKVEIEGKGRLKDSLLRLTDTQADPSEVTVKGPKSLVERAAKARAQLDLATVDASTSKAISLMVDILDQYGRPLEQGLIRSEPMFVRVTPLLTVAPAEKPVFVVPDFKGQVAPGYLSSSFSVNPPQVMVAGASLLLASISKVVTEPIDISGLKDTTTLTARLKIPPGIAATRGQETVQVRVVVQPATVPSPTTP